MMKILPQMFYQNPEVEKILVDGLSCIIHKVINNSVAHKEGYVSTHALTLVLKGVLKVEGESGPPAFVKKNQMIFLPKGLYMISDILPEADSFEAVVFFFDEEVIRNFVTANAIEASKHKCAGYKILDYIPEVRVFTESLLNLYSNKALANRSLTKMKLYELLNILCFSGSNCLLETLATLNNKEKRSLRDFMELNYSKPLSIEDYAYLTGRSLSSFRRDFIDQFDISPKQWLIEKRLDKAKELLNRNHTTVSQVALDVGYENFSHFVKAFHKRYGTPPKQYLLQSRKSVLV